MWSLIHGGMKLIHVSKMAPMFSALAINEEGLVVWNAGFRTDYPYWYGLLVIAHKNTYVHISYHKHTAAVGVILESNHKFDFITMGILMVEHIYSIISDKVLLHKITDLRRNKTIWKYYKNSICVHGWSKWWYIFWRFSSQVGVKMMIYVCVTLRISEWFIFHFLV